MTFDDHSSRVHLVQQTCWCIDLYFPKDTVDGSEIPRPTTWDGAKTLQIMGQTTNLNWFSRQISNEPSFQYQDLKFGEVFRSEKDLRIQLGLLELTISVEVGG